MPDMPSTFHRMVDVNWSWTGNKGPEFRIEYYTNWTDMVALANELMGGRSVSGGGFGTYNPPHRCPFNTNLVCMDLTDGKHGEGVVKGDGSVLKFDPWSLCYMTAVYRAPEYHIVSGVTMVEPDAVNRDKLVGSKQQVRAATGFRLLPKRKLVYDGSSPVKFVDQEASVPEHQSEIVIEFNRVPVSQYNRLRPYLGKISTSAMFGWNAGHVLFDSVDETDGGSDGGEARNVTVTFLAREAHWNEILDDDGVYKKVAFEGTSTRPFAETNLWEVF